MTTMVVSIAQYLYKITKTGVSNYGAILNYHSIPINVKGFLFARQSIPDVAEGHH